MNDNLVNVLCQINTINFDSTTTQKQLIESINLIKDSDIQRLAIYAVDDKMVQRFGSEWLKYLLERYFYKTDNGGRHFYDILTSYLNERNYNLLQICAIILRNGFLGCYSTWPTNIYQEIIRVMAINLPAKASTAPYVPHTNYSKPLAWWIILIPIFITYILFQAIQIIMLYNCKMLGGQ